MIGRKQLWLLAGGNGAGKSTFHRLFLEPTGIKMVNADLIAREIDIAKPEDFSYAASEVAAVLREELLLQGISFCFETVFSHESKINFVGRARALNYEIILIYIHLDTIDLNEARVHQRVTERGHDVPAEKIRERIPRTMKNISLIFPLVDEARILNNSSGDDPFQQVAVVKKGKLISSINPLPGWAREMLADIPE